MVKKRVLFLLVQLTLSSALVYSQQIRSMEFRDQDIKDVLLVLAQQNQISIIPDETVEGRVSYVFSNMDFEQALKIFLDSYNLTYTRENGVYYVSKVRVNFNRSTGRLSLSATDVPLRTLIRFLTVSTGKTILHDSIPNDPFTISLTEGTTEEALKIFLAKFQDYYLDKQDSYYYLRKKSSEAAIVARSGGQSRFIQKNGSNFSLSVDKGRFKDLILDLFSQGQREFILLLDRDTIVENLYITGRTFDEILKILLLQANGDFSINQGIYYITEVQRKDLLKKYLTNLILPLQNISAVDLIRLFPPALSSSNQMKIDEKGNKVILSGSLEEITPLLDFIKLADQPTGGNKLYRMDLHFIKADELLPLLPQEFSSFSPAILPGKSSFLISLPEAKKPSLDQILSLLDKPPLSIPFRLRFIKNEELMGSLPPSVTEANLVKTREPNQMFFRGTETQFQRFLKDLAYIDVPRAQLRYEILILQFEQNEGLNLDTQYKVEKNQNGDSITSTGSFKELLTLSFDVISGLGYEFSANLNAKLSSNNAKVLADTTLNALSGEKVIFQNTDTVRYKDTTNEIDPTTGQPKGTSVVRELSSGLVLDFDGWVSGDGMITMKINSTLSKRRGDSGQTGAPPSTTEKKITTQVRTLSGQPIVIGGLKQEDLVMGISKVPFLGDIPLLGLLFQQRTESLQRSEFAIYIVPHMEQPPLTDETVADRIFGIYTSLGPLK